jgi:hypothetical protein
VTLVQLLILINASRSSCANRMRINASQKASLSGCTAAMIILLGKRGVRSNM